MRDRDSLIHQDSTCPLTPPWPRVPGVSRSALSSDSASEGKPTLAALKRLSSTASAIPEDKVADTFDCPLPPRLQVVGCEESSLGGSEEEEEEEEEINSTDESSGVSTHTDNALIYFQGKIGVSKYGLLSPSFPSSTPIPCTFNTQILIRKLSFAPCRRVPADAGRRYRDQPGYRMSPSECRSCQGGEASRCQDPRPLVRPSTHAASPRATLRIRITIFSD